MDESSQSSMKTVNIGGISVEGDGDIKIEPIGDIKNNNKPAINVPLPDLNKEIKITAR